MADPKFANLPGIAYDQPDTYETPDVPEDDTSDFFEEPENESIERLHIDTKDSYNIFKGKYLTGNIDFSDRIGRKTRTGYDAQSACWELVGEGEKEAPLEKCRRLQCELNELVQEICNMNSDASISQEDKKNFETIGLVVNSAKKVLESLRLEQTLGKEATSDVDVEKMFSQIDEYKKTGGSIDLPKKNLSSVDLAYTTRIAELENRLAKLETLVGAQPDKLSRLGGKTNCDNLLESIQQVSSKAALLTSDQLTTIETRISSLATKLDDIAQKSNSGNDGSADRQVLELYNIAKRTEPVVHLLPNMLQRMKALENLHNYANNFTKIIAELETNQTNLITSQANNKELLENVQEAFAANLENMKKEVQKVEERVKNIDGKK